MVDDQTATTADEQRRTAMTNRRTSSDANANVRAKALNWAKATSHHDEHQVRRCRLWIGSLESARTRLTAQDSSSLPTRAIGAMQGSVRHRRTTSVPLRCCPTWRVQWLQERQEVLRTQISQPEQADVRRPADQTERRHLCSSTPTRRTGSSTSSLLRFQQQPSGRAA